MYEVRSEQVMKYFLLWIHFIRYLFIFVVPCLFLMTWHIFWCNKVEFYLWNQSTIKLCRQFMHTGICDLGTTLAQELYKWHLFQYPIMIQKASEMIDFNHDYYYCCYWLREGLTLINFIYGFRHWHMFNICIKIGPNHLVARFRVHDLTHCSIGHMQFQKPLGSGMPFCFLNAFLEF